MQLKKEVEKFKKWASSYAIETRSGEWECDYLEWPQLHQTVMDFLKHHKVENWTSENICDLLYVIARDNEIEFIAEEVAKNPKMLVRLVEAALDSEEVDAKWQLAVQLGNSDKAISNAEELLLKFIEDQDEYVSRRALLALGELGSGKAEELAVKAWETGHEYQRIAALWVMKKVCSSKLDNYIEHALKDGRKYVVQNALEVQ